MLVPDRAAIEALLSSRFKGADKSAIAHWASELCDEYALMGILEGMERNDRPPTKDLEAIAKARSDLLKAAKSLEAVGWRGGVALADAAEYVSKGEQAFPFSKQVMQVAPYISGHLEALADEMSAALKSIDPDAPPIMAALGGGVAVFSGTKKPAETQAQSLALKCGKAFEEISGEAAIVSTNSATSEAYGPFLEFVTEAFSVFEIEASPETWARAAGRFLKARRKGPNF